MSGMSAPYGLVQFNTMRDGCQEAVLDIGGTVIAALHHSRECKFIGFTAAAMDEDFSLDSKLNRSSEEVPHEMGTAGGEVQ